VIAVSGHVLANEASDQVDSVTLGVSPWTSPQLLHAWIEPMRARLEQQTGQLFTIKSSNDLESYLIDNIEGKFTASQMPLHMSLYLIRYHQFKPVLIARAGVRTYILTLANSGINSLQALQELHHEPYLLPDPISIVGFMTKEALPGKPLSSYQHSKNHWLVLNHLLNKNIKAGSVLSPMYDGLTESIKKQFKVIYESPLEFDGMYLMPPESSPKERIKVFNTLNGFKPDTKSIVKKIEPISDKELAYWFKVMGKYGDQIHEYMKAKYPNDSRFNGL
jgi:hypothetical protein